jgi:hypothetical protein
VAKAWVAWVNSCDCQATVECTAALGKVAAVPEVGVGLVAESAGEEEEGGGHCWSWNVVDGYGG